MDKARFITVKTFSRLTGLSLNTIYNYCRAGKLSFTVINTGEKKKTRLIDYAAFIEQMEKNIQVSKIQNKFTGLKKEQEIDWDHLEELLP